MPPLLKTFSARSIYPVKNLVLLSKRERIFGLGAGLLQSTSVTKVSMIIDKHSNEKDHMITRLRSRDLEEREITSFVRPT